MRSKLKDAYGEINRLTLDVSRKDEELRTSAELTEKLKKKVAELSQEGIEKQTEFELWALFTLLYIIVGNGGI
jgi:hypothetical protein